MATRCPKCHGTYPDTVKYCDQDGSPLTSNSTVAATRRQRSGIRWIALMLIIGGLAGAVCAAYYLGRHHLQSKITLVFEDVLVNGNISLTRRSKDKTLATQLAEGILGAAKVTLGTENLIVRVKCRNTTPFAGAITAARYTISAGDKEIASGEWLPASAVVFQPDREVSIDLPLRFDTSNTLSAAIDAISGKPGQIKIQGDLDAKLSIMKLRIPFEAYLVKPAIQVETHVY